MNRVNQDVRWTSVRRSVASHSAYAPRHPPLYRALLEYGKSASHGTLVTGSSCMGTTGRRARHTVITAGYGPLRGQRVIAGREDECRALYARAPARSKPNAEAQAASCGTWLALHAERRFTISWRMTQ